MHPHFLIIGAQKSGTTSLADSLAMRPDVFVCEPREPEYFSRCHLTDGTGLPINAYLNLFQSADPSSLCGEASTGTMLHPESIPDIEKLNAQIKLIAILRRPADRAYSACQHSVKKGRVSIAEADRLFAEEANRYLTGKPCRFDWFHRSEYATLLTPFHQKFQNRLLILIFEEMMAEPEKCLSLVQKFLELSPPFVTTFLAENTTRVPSGRFSEKVIALGRRAVGPIRRRLTERGYRQFRSQLLQILGKKPNHLDPTLATQLNHAFRPEITGVEQILGRAIPAWK